MHKCTYVCSCQYRNLITNTFWKISPFIQYSCLFSLIPLIGIPCQWLKNKDVNSSKCLASSCSVASFPGSSAGKESTCNAEDSVLIPGLGRSPGEGNSYPLQYTGLENSMDCIVHEVAKSQTWLSNFHFHKLLLHGVETEVQSSLTTCPSSQRRN